MRHLKKIYSLTLILISIYLSFSQPITAETNNDYDNMIMREQNRLKMDNNIQIQNQTEKLFNNKIIYPPEQKFDQKIPSPQVSFAIETIEFSGANSLSTITEQQLKNPYLNRKIDINSINDLVRDVTNYYIRNGYITTQIYIPPQDLKSNKLRIQIMEGKIEDIRSNFFTATQLFLAFGPLKGQILNIRNLEQGLDQLNRLNCNQATLDLIPSTANTNNTIVVISNKLIQTYQSKIKYETYNDPLMQTLPNSIDLTKENFLGINDSILLSFYNRIQTKEKSQNSFALNFSIPFNYLTFSLGYNQFSYLNASYSMGNVINMSGINKNLQGNIEILLFRNQIMKTSLKTGLISKERQGYNGDITIDNQTDHKILYTIALSQTIYNYFGNWFTNLIYTQSFSGMGATKDSINLSISDPHQQFKKYNLDLNWSQNIDLFTKTSTPSSNPIHSTFRFQSNLSAQYSPEVTLLDTERISIGDYYTVRGYINNQVGDCGYYIRNELSYSLSSLFLALHPYDWANYTMLIHGIDIGYVYKNYGTDNNGQKAAKLISGILGIKYFGLNHNWDLTYAIPLTTSMADNTGIWYFGTTINL